MEFYSVVSVEASAYSPEMLSTEMHLIECQGFGDPEILKMTARPMPVPGSGEVLIKVAAAGLNRADLLQRQGKYPPPPGASDILGMEVSGTIAAMGPNTKEWKIGDQVCALLSSGGYAEYVTAHEAQCLSIPTKVSLIEAAALPEAITTVYANIFEDGKFQSGETILVHGGSSGIGTTAIQMIKACGGKVFVTAGNAAKAEFCRKLGADLAIDYHEHDFVTGVEEATGGRGVDIILDMVGGDYINRNLQILAPQGRHVSIATQSGKMANVDIRVMMQKNLTLTGSTLRSRTADEKYRLLAAIEQKFWPLIAARKIKPVIYQSFPLKNAAEAHKVMESGAHMGKMLLEIS